MNTIDLGDLRAEMEAEREWREKEIRLLKNQVGRLDRENDRGIFRKSLVVMLYAHFEGTCKALFSMYVARLNALSIVVEKVQSSLAASALADVFQTLRDPNKKCPEFARALPDDSALHRFARDRDFVEYNLHILARTMRINSDVIVDTESNLRPVVLRKILFRLGLDPSSIEYLESPLNSLLGYRNAIAHGAFKDGITDAQYQKLEQAATLVIDAVIQLISRAVITEAHLRTS